MRSSPVNAGDNVLATQYDNLRLDAQPASYLYPHQQSSPGLTLYIEAANYWIGGTRIVFAGGNTPSFTAPSTNPRIDLVVIDNAGTVSIVQGTENASPAVPAYPKDKIVICEIYNRVGEASIKDSDDSTNGYIQRDVRPFINNGKFISQSGAEIFVGSDTGSANAYAVALSPAITAYVDGQIVIFRAAHGNTAASTVAVNGLAAKTIKKNGSADLAANDIITGALVVLVYDSTNGYFQMASQLGQVPAGTNLQTAIFNAGETISANDACIILDDLFQGYMCDITPGSGLDDAYAVGKNSTYQQRAIKIKPNNQITISTIKAYIAKFNSPSDNIQIQIQADSSGSPSGSAITNGTSSNVAGSGLSANFYQENSFNFSTPPTLTADTVYWIVFKRTSTLSDSNYYMVNGFGRPNQQVDNSHASYGNFSGKYYTGSSWSGSPGCSYFEIILSTGNPSRRVWHSDGANFCLQRFDGFAASAASVGSAVTLIDTGFVGGFASLTPGAYYYIGSAGAVSSSQASYGGPIGRAVSTTQIQLIAGMNRFTTWAQLMNNRVAGVNGIQIFFATGFKARKVSVIASSTCCISIGYGFGDGGGTTGKGTCVYFDSSSSFNAFANADPQRILWGSNNNTTRYFGTMVRSTEFGIYLSVDDSSGDGRNIAIQVAAEG